MPEGTRSLPCRPCRVAAAAAVWTGMEEALRARPPLDQRRSPRLRQPPRVGGEGARGACPPPTWWPLAEAAVLPAGGDRRRGNARLLRAAEMWLKTSGSDGGGGVALPGGGGG